MRDIAQQCRDVADGSSARTAALYDVANEAIGLYLLMCDHCPITPREFEPLETALQQFSEDMP
jgi:hypothetical protein